MSLAPLLTETSNREWFVLDPASGMTQRATEAAARATAAERAGATVWYRTVTTGPLTRAEATP